MTESQNIEFKESWRDEYQKCICGFANAQGGVLYVGVKDNGEVCGVQNAKKNDGGHSKQGTRHDGYIGGCQFEREGREAMSGDCYRGVPLSCQFPWQVLPAKWCNQSGIERSGTRPLHAS